MPRKKLKKRKSKPEVRDYTTVQSKIVPVSKLTTRLKTVIYGKAGTGKTTLACTFPKPILLIDANEQGTDSVSDIPELDVFRITEWPDMSALYWALKKKAFKTKYKTVIWDTVSQIQDLAIKQILEDHNKEDEEDVGGWGTMTRKMWGTTATLLKQEILNWRDLKLNVVFVAHDRIFNVDDDEGDEGLIEPSVGPRLMPSVASTLNAAVGIIGNTFIRERFRKIKIKKKVREKRKVEYCLRIGPHAYYTTKVRKPKSRELPELLIDPDYEKIVELVKGFKNE